MGIKISKLEVIGLRGIKAPLSLDLDGKSILLYGDNGTGKSSLSDSLEWYYTDSVSHLTGEEIDLKSALRNYYLEKTEVSAIDLSLSKPMFSSERNLFFKKDKLISEFSNISDDFNQYLNRSKKENIILRHQFLREFIDRTKGQKLSNLADIIGYSEVNKTKDILKKVFNGLKSEIKSQNYETQITTQKETLISKIGASVSQEANLLEILNGIIAPLGIKTKIIAMSDIDTVLNQLKTPATTRFTSELTFLEKCHTALSNLSREVSLIDSEYEKYFKEFMIIANDVEAIMQTFLAELLQAGNEVLSKKYHKLDSCPLCLQPKRIEELQAEIKTRLTQIAESSKKKATFDNAKISITAIATERIRRLDMLSGEPQLNEPANQEIVMAIKGLRQKLETYQKAGNERVSSGNKIGTAAALKLQEEDFAQIATIEARTEKIRAAIAGDNTTLWYANISAARDAFLKIKKFEVERAKLEQQKDSLEVIYNAFVIKQKEGLQNFIDNFSGTINDFYQDMNPGELFGELRIVTMGDEDELTGITIEYLYNGVWASPPQKYFSESHLNCFGLAFFLASVIAFNKENKFIVLDDIISSFDTTHRNRFANLLVEKFKDFQIILLTHEEEWFKFVRQLAKRNGQWLIKEIRWSEDKGTHIEESTGDLKQLIETKLAEGDTGLLGNPTRRYLEHILKKIALNLEVKVSFRFNENNELRMPDELLSELKARINKSSQDLKAKMSVIERVANSSVLGNLLSHDNFFNSKIGDIKAFWEDIKNFEKLFTCQQSDCTKPDVSLKNYDTVEKQIRCGGCGKTKYDWK